ncbi:MAG: alpha/beta hydrolase [Isosphaeraceae bacterium]
MALILVAWIVKARQDPPPANVEFTPNIVYREVGGETLHLDLARPRYAEGPAPCVVFIHGGGWRAGSRREYREGLFGSASQGIAAVSIQYRFAPRNTFPSQLDDVKSAVRFVREHAGKWKIDPDRIAVMGGSAGAHLALLLATTADEDPVDSPGSTTVKAAVSFAGPTDLTRTFPDASRFMVEDLLGPGGKADVAARRSASPIHHLNAGDPPVLLIHGTKDELVPYDQATEFARACKEAGVEAELLTIEGGGHGGGDPEAWKQAILRSFGFLREHLGMAPIPGTGPHNAP